MTRVPAKVNSQMERDAQRGYHSPVIGLLWGDFPWEDTPRKVGKLLSSGVVGRNVARALRSIGTVVPCRPPDGTSLEEQTAALTSFLHSIDVLWADLYPTSDQAVRLRHELDLPCRVMLYAGGTIPKAAEAMLFPWRDLLRPGDNVLLTCRADLAIWQRLMEWSRLRAWVVPLPVDETVFRPRTIDRAAVRARHGLPPHAPLLLYVGRLNIQKNLHTLLRLYASVRRQVPETHLCLVGDTDDIALAEFRMQNSGYVDRLQALAQELDVADSLTFLPPLFGEDLADLYRASDIVVNAGFYHRENFGLSQAEAQACGVPVVCSDWGGFKDVVRPGETGYLMDAVLTRHGIRVDWASGAEHVVRLLRDDAARHDMGARAASWAREQFGVDVFAHRLERILEASSPEADGPDERTAYEPSEFARRYEEHKRASGWYATPSARSAPNLPDTRLFQGEEYELYETMMEPYVTRLARELPAPALQTDWVPYFPSGVELDREQRAARDLDLVWPHERGIQPIAWDVLQRVDGTRSLAQIVVSLPEHDPSAVREAMYDLYLDGFVLWKTWSG